MQIINIVNKIVKTLNDVVSMYRKKQIRDVQKKLRNTFKAAKNIL
jgi:hypothetical protein